MADVEQRKGFEPARGWRFLVAGVLAATFLLLDRVTKAAVLGSLEAGAWSMQVIPGLFRFEFVANTGAAFSIGEGMGGAFVLLAAVVLAFTIYYLLKSPAISKLEVVGLGMVVGGAIGNAIDRVLYGFVVDFICTEFIDFPVFNVADIGITCGVVIAFLGFVLLSPANKVDATAELNRRDEEAARRRAKKRGERAAKWREKNDGTR